MKENQFQRKTIIIKKNIQYKYMFMIFFTSFVAFVLVGVDMIFTLHKVVEEHPAMIPLLDEIFSNIPLMVFKLIIYMLIVIIASSVVSHKIAGPIYKFEKICNSIAKGDLTQRVYLRRGDLLVDLQKSFNEMLENIHFITKLNEELKNNLKSKNIETEKIEEIEKKIKEKMPEFKL